MSDGAQHAYPAEVTIERCWMDPLRRPPQRLMETPEEQRISPLGQIGEMIDTTLIVRRRWKVENRVGGHMKKANYLLIICSHFLLIFPVLYLIIQHALAQKQFIVPD